MLRRVGLILGLTIVVVGLFVSLAGYRPGPSPEGTDARIAVINSVIEAVNTSQAHASGCINGFTDLTQAKLTPDKVQGHMIQTTHCGPTARTIAEAGYSTLEQVSRGPDGPTKAQFLDVAAVAIATYEVQGDDFDAVHALLSDAIGEGAALSGLHTIVQDHLSAVSADLSTIHDALRDAQAGYRADEN